MAEKFLGLGLILTVILLSGCVQEQPEEQNISILTNENVSALTIVDVSQHNSSEDCWIAINDKVYDVTDFIPSHPGGKAILQGCGIDATTLFETRPMGSGTPHSDNARDTLERYYIGELNN